jgi:hypothetical protein
MSDVRAMKTIILHIGYPKTGTSSLQWFLHTHRDAIRRQGVYYPLTGQAPDHAHHQLPFSLGANPHRGVGLDPEPSPLFSALASEIDECGADTIVLSSEVFLGNLERLRASREVAAILEGRTLRVICFVRRQATFLESLYRQFIWGPKTRFAGRPDAFIDANPVVGDYHGPLSMWRAWVGPNNIDTVVYEQAQRGKGCISEFCRLAGIDVSQLPLADLETRRNIAPSSAATELMRMGNGYAHLSLDQWEVFAKRAREFDQMTSHLSLPTALFTASDIAHIEERYLESNRRLAEDFVHQPLDGMWFRETIDS